MGVLSRFEADRHAMFVFKLKVPASYSSCLYSYVRDWFQHEYVYGHTLELVVFLIAPVDGSISCCADVL